jgi:hypothetical protein
MKFLLILDWTLWSALLLALIYALVAILTERSRSPEAGPGLGIFLIILGLGFSAATGASLFWFAQKQSITGTVLMSLVLAWPLVPVVARPVMLAYKNWKFAQEKNSPENLPAS